MTTVSAVAPELVPWCSSSSALKCALATVAAVTCGFSGGSGEMLRSGDLDIEGDRMLTELARRGGATPFTE